MSIAGFRKSKHYLFLLLALIAVSGAYFGLSVFRGERTFNESDDVGEHRHTEARQALRFGFNHVPPDSMYIDNIAQGPAIDYLRLIAEQAGFATVEFIKMPLARIVQGITANTIDGVPRIGGRGYPDSFFYAAEPFSHSFPGFLVSNEFHLEGIESSSQLDGLIVATKLAMPLTPSLEGADVHWEWIAAQNPLENAIRMLVNGRIDAVYSPSLAELIFMAGELGVFSKLRPVRLPDDPWPVFVAFSQEGAKKFKSQYDEINERLQYEGTYQQIFEDFAAREFLKRGIDLSYLDLLRPLRRSED